jgi:2-keto-3-deoxy-L-fuconate dehydrogenase
MNLNARAQFWMIQAVLPNMLANGGGSIINMASVASSIKGLPNRFVYGVSKAAVIGLTKAVAADYVGQGIRCNAIAPGGVNTHIADALIPNALGYERCMLGTPTMPRMGDPDEIARLALFLCSDDASLINGAVITADAGWSAY